jgi:integrase
MARISTGTVRRRPSGAFEVRWRDGRGERFSRSFSTASAAREFLQRVLADLQRGDDIDPRRGRRTFGEYAEDWLEGAGPRLRPRTLAGYRSILDRHLLPELGDRPVAAIDHPLIQRYISRLVVEGKSANTVKRIHTVARQVFKVARLAGAIRYNPASDIQLPSVRRHRATALDASQVQQLVDAMPSPFDLAVLFTAYTGLRAGEIWALRLRHVDLMRRTVTVEEAISEVTGGVVFGEPKSDTSRRTIALPRFLCERVYDHLSTRPADPSALLFCDDDEQPIRHTTFYGRVWRPTVARLAAIDPNFPAALRFHDLRHTAASLLINSGADAKAVQHRLGHSTTALTLDTYSHIFDARDRELADALEIMFDRAGDSRAEAT